MSLRWISLSALLVLGCSGPMAHVSDYGGAEGWPPTVSAVQPSAGQAGAVVALRGAYLDDATQVLIGGRPASFTVAGRGLQATVPADLGPGQVKVVVLVPRGMTAPATFRVLP